MLRIPIPKCCKTQITPAWCNFDLHRFHMNEISRAFLTSFFVKTNQLWGHLCKSDEICKWPQGRVLYSNGLCYFSMNIKCSETKGLTKTELHEHSCKDKYRENQWLYIYYVEHISDQFKWHVLATYASYSPPPPVQTMATKLILSC